MIGGIALQQLCNYIILVSAVIIAGKNIYAFFKKPVDDIQDKVRIAEEQRIKAILQREAPTLCATMQKEVMLSLEELKAQNKDQYNALNKLQASINLINETELDTMRYQMNRLYYKYRPYKKILDYDKKAFLKFYNDYHSRGGNTWIDSIYPEVASWEVVQDINELKIDN